MEMEGEMAENGPQRGGKTHLAYRLPAEIRSALERSGLPWSAENGGAHIKLKLKGRLVGVIGKGRPSEGDGRALHNTISQIRRAARQMAN